MHQSIPVWLARIAKPLNLCPTKLKNHERDNLLQIRNPSRRLFFFLNHPNGANEKKVKSPARLFSNFPHLTRKLNNLFALLTVRLSVPRRGRRLPKKRRQILLFLFSSFRSVRPQVSNDSMKFRPNTNSGQKNCYNMFCNDILGQIELLGPHSKLI